MTPTRRSLTWITPAPLAVPVMVAATCLALAGQALAADDPPGTQPATQPAATSTAPATGVSEAVERILDRLERRGDQITAIEAVIEFTKIDPVLEDRQEYQGTLRFKRSEPNPRFWIEFDQFRHENIVRKEKQWHVFDGQWYIEARENTRQITKRQIVRPGQALDVFKLGQGPFPLPFGQKKAEILKYFEVRLVPAQPKDPEHADHLLCTPRPGTELADKYDTVHFYIDRTLDLPVRVQTTEKQEGTEIIAAFPKITVNPGLVESQLNLPDLPDYQIDTIPLTDPPK